MTDARPFWEDRGLTDLPAAEARTLLARLNPLFTLPVDAASARVAARDLPFWRGARLIRVTDGETVPPIDRHGIVTDQGAAVFDGTDAFLSALGAPRLTDDTLPEWVRLWLAAVADPDGAVRLVEGPEDLEFDNEMDPATVDRFAAAAHPVWVVAGATPGPWRVEATGTAEDSLVAVTLSVAPDGRVATDGPDRTLATLPGPDLAAARLL